MSEPCQLCGAGEHETVSRTDRHGGPLQTVICMGCGIVTNDPIPSDDELAEFYRSDYRKDYKGTAEPRMRQVWRNFDRLQTHFAANRDVYATRKNCLDLGAGSGEFMFLARAAGIDCIGIEPNSDYSAYCRDRLDLDVRSMTLEEAEFADGSFDLIRLSHVLEHMRNPVRSLKVLYRWLGDDGVLYIEVPDIAVEADRKVRGKLFHFGHIFNFDPFTLRIAAGLAGFEELPETAKRHRGTTGVFLRKAAAPYVLPEGREEHAQMLKSALERHYERSVPQPPQGNAAGRFLSTTAHRLKEMIQARRYADHRAIADHFAGLLRTGAAGK